MLSNDIHSNLKKARWQSKNVIINSIRMKRVPDAAIEREIRKCIKDFDGEIERLIFINRKRIIKRIK